MQPDLDLFPIVQHVVGHSNCAYTKTTDPDKGPRQAGHLRMETQLAGFQFFYFVVHKYFEVVLTSLLGLASLECPARA